MRTGERGFTYLLLLFAIALGGIGLAALGEQARLRQQREQEAELMFSGAQIARAIASYRAASPAGSRALPGSIDDLLEDRRSGRPVRHLRQVYRDPLAPAGDAARRDGGWEWLPPGAGGCGSASHPAPGITAVRSRSTRELLRRGDKERLRACELIFRHEAFAGQTTAPAHNTPAP